MNPPSMPNRLSFTDPLLQDLKSSLLDSEAAKNSLLQNFSFKKKILVLGYLGTGKSSIVLRFHYDFLLQSTGGPEEEYNSTLKYKNEDYLLQIVDFIGMDEYTPIYANKYGVKVDGYVLVYSIDNRKSFEYVRDLREKLRTINGRDVPCVLVGNKADLKDERQVSTKEGLKVAKAFEVPFLEISAEKHSHDYIKKVFEEILKEILKSEIQEGGIKRLKDWDITKVEQLYHIFLFGSVLLMCIGLFFICFGVSNYVVYPESLETHSAILVLFVLNGFLAITLAVLGIYGMKKQAIDCIYVFKILAGFSLALDVSCAIIMIISQAESDDGSGDSHSSDTKPQDRFIDVGPLIYILLGMLFIILVLLLGISCFAKEIFAKRRLATSNRFPLLRV